MRYFIRLSYKGTNYHGWQIQPNAITVQETIQNALKTIFKSEAEIVGCGRTDTGVHAKNYIAHFDSEAEIDCPTFCHKINQILPKDIVLHQIYKVDDSMHSRFSAKSRTYEYFITRTKDPFHLETSIHIWGELNIQEMNKACKVLFDFSDFTSFSKLHTDTHTNNCKIMQAQWEQVSPELLIFTIKADRFLRNMVRAIVGTMLEIGRGKLSIEDFKTIIESKNRSNAGMSVPPEGLFLCEIEY